MNPLETIIKLINLSYKGGNEGAAAMQKAYELSKKHNIKPAQLAQHPNSFYRIEALRKFSAYWIEQENAADDKARSERYESKEGEFHSFHSKKTTPQKSYRTTCKQCGKNLDQHEGDTRNNYGRPRQYCSDACKMKAARARNRR